MIKTTQVSSIIFPHFKQLDSDSTDFEYNFGNTISVLEIFLERIFQKYLWLNLKYVF